MSVSHPDGTKESYGYEGGTWDGTTFTSNTDPGSSHAAIRTSIIHGCASSVTGSTEVTSLDGGEAIDPIYLISGKSTKDVTVRQASNVVGQAESGNVVQSETWVWGGAAWTRVAWVNFAHDSGGQLTQRSASDGSTYSATWVGDFKKSETDAAGIVTSYANDGSWRVQTATVNAGTQLAALTTQFTYDGEGRLIKKVIGSNLSETLTSSVSYDTAGRKTSETAPGNIVTSYEYPSNGSDLKTDFANGGSKLVAHNQDGSIQSVTGTAAVAEYYSYDIRSDGAIHTVRRLGDSASSRVEETWTDMLGRKVEVLRPGFAGGVGYMQLWSYDPSTGQLSSMSREDANGNRVAADTRYEYDLMGQLHRTGLAIDNSTQLTVAGDDRITDVDSIYKQDTINGISAWWLERTTTTYPMVNSSNGFVTNVTFDRLTGLGGALQKDSISKDADGNITEVQTLVDGTAHTVTASMSTAGTTNASTTITVAGLIIQSTGFDGLTRKTGYDTLWRPYQTTDARNNTSTTGFSPNTSRPASITDPAGNLTVSYTFDAAGRVSTATNVSGNVTRYAYDYLDRVTNQWGDGAYPVAYSYDEFGSKVTVTSYRAGSGWGGTTWPSSTNLGKGDVTTWAYDPATGLLVSKTDDAAAQIKYTYTVMGAVYQRTSARGVVTTYGYDPSTAELTSVTYSDGTHPLNYSYARTGALNWAQDATSTGANDYTRFNYNPSQPLQLQSIQFGQFFSNRFFTPQYNTDGLRPGRNTGYFLGASASSASDLSQTYGYDNTMRLHQVTSASAGQGSVAFTYTYSPGTDWVGQMAASGPNGTYQVNYAYENKRGLVTQAQASWGGSAGTVLAEFDYQYDAQGRRRSAQKSGAAFADLYSGAAVTPVYSYYVYDAKGELQTEVAYRGVPPSSGAPASGDEIPGRRFEYRYDNFGNRAVTGPADPNGSASAVDDAYTTANYGHLNQYDSKQNNTIRVLGDAVVGASVTIPGASVNQLDRNFGASVVPANNSGPAHGSIPVTANVTVGGTTYTDTQSRNYLVPSASQPMEYDADGNLTSDGMWTYIYDGEDRLVEMDSQLPSGQGFTRWELKFKYDYLGRRVEKQVYNMDVSLSSPTLDHKFIYSGWNLIAETDASGSLLKTCTWGLDIASSFTETGGVGALLEYAAISNGAPINYFVAVDAMGNVAALVSSTGSQAAPSLAAVYEYASFGEPLRAEILDTTVAANPFRFSSKYTDAESGLVYYGSRYYSAPLGRFVNRDPAEESGGLNLYGFVGNDPINHCDVLGNGPTPLDPYVVVGQRYNGDPMQEWSDQNLINSVWGQQVGQYLNGNTPPFSGFNPFIAAPSLSLLAQAMATRNAILQAQQAQNIRLKSNIRLRMYAMLGALRGIADAKGIDISPNSPFGGFISRLFAYQSGLQAAAIDVVQGQWKSFLSAGFDTNRMLLNQGLGTANAILHLPTILRGIMNGYQTAADTQDGGAALSKFLGYGMFHVALAAALAGEGSAPAAESAAGRTVALDSNAFYELGRLKSSGVLQAGDQLVVTPGVQAELFRHGVTAGDLSSAGITALSESPIGVSVPATRLAEVLRGFGGPGAASAAADAFNVSEAAALRADLFLTNDAQVLRAFQGGVTLPNSGGVFINVRGF